MTFWMMLDDGLDDIGRRLRWRVTFWITLDEGLDDADDVLDDVLADGWRRMMLQMTAGRRFTTDAAAAAANIPSYYIDDG